MAEEMKKTETAARHRLVALSCIVFVAAMVGAAYAAVPLYNIFCRVTGYGGSPVIAEAAPLKVIDRTFEIRFDSNMNGALPWRFRPDQVSVKVKAGEVKTIYYHITSDAAATTTGIASYNIAPADASPYFSKISCFCFSEQTLKPGETQELPVVFFIDPSIDDNHDLDSVRTITLSYTFYPSAKPATPVASASPGPDRPKL